MIGYNKKKSHFKPAFNKRNCAKQCTSKSITARRKKRKKKREQFGQKMTELMEKAHTHIKVDSMTFV